MIKRKAIFLSVGLAAVLLTGCGNSTGPSTDTSQALLKGVAVDDLIVNGKVKAYDPQNPSVILAEGRTDQNDGSYVLKVEHEGVVVVEVSCDDKSKMKNPATGAIKVCEQNMKLHSAAALSKEKKEVIVNISPITELVVRQMEDKGVSKENLESAQSNIGLMFGFDPLGENPVENDQYVKVINAVHQLADNETNKNILEVVEKLSEDLVDGEAGDDGDITQKFAEVMAAVGANNNLTANHGRYKPEEAAAGGSSGDSSEGTETTSPGNSQGGSSSSPGGSTSSSGGAASSSGGSVSAPTDIELAKQFFDELRTQTMSITDYQNSGTPGFLDSEAEKLGYVLENITMDTKTAGRYIIGLVSDIIHYISVNKSEKVDGEADNVSDTYEKEIDDVFSIIYKKESSLIWSYKITENDEEKYIGTVTLPSEDPENISMSDFTGTLQVKFDGTVPLEGYLFKEADGASDSSGASSSLEEQPSSHTLSAMGTAIQEVHADIALEKKDYGADFVLNNVSLTSAGTTVAIKDILINAYYGFDAKNKLQMGHILFNQATVSARTGAYTFNGKIEVPEYVLNDNIKDKGFMEEEYTTYVHGSVICLSEHNERIYEIKNGTVTYTDQSGNQHPLNLSPDGYFWADIEGNVENLDPEEYGYSSTANTGSAQDWSKYIGLTFDNLTITSGKCDNIKLEVLEINVNNEQNNTTVTGNAFCVKDSQRTDIEGGNVVYTDKYGIAHEPVADTKDENFNGQFIIVFSGSDEITKNVKRYKAAGFIHNIIESDKVEINADNCANPLLTYLFFDLDQDEIFTNSGYLPKKINFDGNISNSVNNSAISGHLGVDWLNAATMDLKDGKAVVNVNLTGKIKMPQRPEMILNLGYTNAANQNDFSFSYLYDTTAINGTGAFDKEMENGTIILSTHNGLRATIMVKNREVVYGEQSNISRNGTPVGHLEELTEGVPVIRYTDGSFESLP